MFLKKCFKVHERGQSFQTFTQFNLFMAEYKFFDMQLIFALFYLAQ